MANFAKIEGEIILSSFSDIPLVPEISGAMVSAVVVVSNEQEHRGEEFLSQEVGLGGRWIQTSYNTHKGVHKSEKTPLRKNYAGIGYIYDYNRDAFIPPLPSPVVAPETGSWYLNEQECWWYYYPSGSYPS